jgi:hypothetical protein
MKFRISIFLDDIQAVKAKLGKGKILKNRRVKVYQIPQFGLKILHTHNEPMHNDYFWHKTYGDYPVLE